MNPLDSMTWQQRFEYCLHCLFLAHRRIAELEDEIRQLELERFREANKSVLSRR